ncbi:hypothetical protein GY45DRAFT_1344641 [Cubamyces sp. BRFM 1775]|nr:hypothetical protein GY45DRAFT_1344641 [Cubamyces sp. BRFM 1775]
MPSSPSSRSTGIRVPDDPRLYVNAITPFSALVCGVQGPGKSHTVSVILESMMIVECPAIGSCRRLLSGLVLHFSEGGQGSLPCEAAWLAQMNFQSGYAYLPSVRVYVSESSFSTMKKVYAPLGDYVTVHLLTLTFELDAKATLSMMAIGFSEAAPLYMQSVLLGENLTYTRFLAEIQEAKKDMNPHQKAPLEQRLSLLASFVDPLKSRTGALFRAGWLTVTDLPGPFIDPSSACSLFEIVTRLFVRADVGTGKVLVVDEAHKYLSATRDDTGSTNALTSLIRQQRHLSMRVVLSTQEPTAVPPHHIFRRFSSPAWWDSVAKRVCADISNEQGFNQVVKLKTGQALVLCPSGLGLSSTACKTPSGAVV